MAEGRQVLAAVAEVSDAVLGRAVRAFIGVTTVSVSQDDNGVIRLESPRVPPRTHGVVVALLQTVHPLIDGDAQQ